MTSMWMNVPLSLSFPFTSLYVFQEETLKKRLVIVERNHYVACRKIPSLDEIHSVEGNNI